MKQESVNSPIQWEVENIFNNRCWLSIKIKKSTLTFTSHHTKKIKDISCPKIKDKTVKVSRQNIAEIPT